MPRWATAWIVAVATLATTGFGVAAAQYDDGLPTGLDAITVDDQPIDASVTPQVATRTPVFAGRLSSGATEVEIGLGNGEIVRFPLDVDPANGRFRGAAPDPLEPTTYALYVDDALVGQFVVTAAATDVENAGGTLDLARLVPYPFDLTETYPALGVIRDPQLPVRFYTLAEAARQNGTGDADAVRQSQQALREIGFRQRYDGVLAVPAADDPTRFAVQIVSSAVEYAAADAAQAAFAAGAVDGGEQVDAAATVGDESRFLRAEEVAVRTEAPYRSLIFTFRQDRVVVRVVIADLDGGEPDLATGEALAAALQERTAALLGEEAVSLGLEALRLDLGGGELGADVLQSYDVLDGEVVAVYGEAEEARAARETAFAGTTDVFRSTLSARRGAAAGRTATPAAGGDAPTGGAVSYRVSLLAFPDDGGAVAWLDGLGERLAEDVSYLSLASIPDATIFGDGSAAYGFRRQEGEQSVGGVGFYVRVGSQVFSLEAAGAPEQSLAVVEPLVAAQTACVEAGRCPDPAPLGPEADAAGTPEAAPEGDDRPTREERRRQREEQGEAGDA